MAVKLRLMRMGKKKHPTYRVVAADSRSPRDGRIIELIGRYDPHPHPSVVEIDNERALHWLTVGAQPTDAVRKLLEISGAWGQFRIARGDVHVVGDVAPPPEKEKLSRKAKAKAAEEPQPAAEEPQQAAEEASGVEDASVDEVSVEGAAAADESPLEETVAAEPEPEPVPEAATPEENEMHAPAEGTGEIPEPVPETAEDPVAETGDEASESADAAKEKA